LLKKNKKQSHKVQSQREKENTKREPLIMPTADPGVVADEKDLP